MSRRRSKRRSLKVSGLFSIAGTDAFVINAIKAMKQLGFEGTIVGSVSAPSPDLIAGIPGGLEGVVSFSSATDDPTDPEFQTYSAVMDTYAPDTTRNISAQLAYVGTLAFVRALTGVESAVDAPSVATAMSTMPEPVALPLGGGVTFQCGAGAVNFAPAICTTQLLKGVLDADGKAVSHEVLDVGEFLSLG